MRIEAIAHARAGLLGNPSDGYHGKTISVSVRDFEAAVELVESRELRIEPGETDRDVYASLDDLAARVRLHGPYGGARLVKAAIVRLHDYCAASGVTLPRRNFTARYRTTIPRQVGLAGSSAIVTAALRALVAFHEVEIPTEILPNLVLEAETEGLGIRAGLQDRVIQVYGGCVYMDFDRERMEATGYGLYEPLDPARLPPLYLAWREDLGKVSGTVHDELRARWDRGDPGVRTTIERIAALADEGRRALEAGDAERFSALVDENFDLRSRIVSIRPGDREMVEAARGVGASAKFAGSGGAIVGVVPGGKGLDTLRDALERLGARVLAPRIE